MPDRGTPLSTATTRQPMLSLDPLETSPQPTETSIASESVREVPRLDWPGTDLATLSSIFRHSGWAPVRRRIAASLRRTVQPVNRILAFEGCGDQIHVLQSDDDPKIYRLAGNYCRDRWCTPCALDRSRVIAHNVLELAGTTRLRFATLTLRAEPELLVSRLAFLRSCFLRLKRTRLWKRSVSAGIACLEVKRYKTVEGWHCHYHLLFHGKYIVREELARAWKAITGDSDIVDVRLAKSRANVVRYVTKYVSKPLDMTYLRNDALLDEAILALKGVRLIDTFGAWRGKSLTEVPDTGEWTDVGTLDGILIAAYEGNTWAARIVRCLRRPGIADAMLAASEYQPPVLPRPPPVAPTTPSLFGDEGYMVQGNGF